MITADEAREITAGAKAAKQAKAERDLADSKEAIEALIDDGSAIEEVIRLHAGSNSESAKLDMDFFLRQPGVKAGVDGNFITQKLKEKLEPHGFKIYHNACWTIFWGKK
jgi:hypothetical protein